MKLRFYMKLKTERLILRELEEKDNKKLVELVDDLEISQYLLVVPYPYTLNDANWFVNHCKEESSKDPRTSYELGICDKEDNLMGVIGLTSIEDGNATIGYWLGKPFWRNGYVSEALDKIIDFAFNELHLKKIRAGVFEENIPSAKLLEKCGFKYIGEGKRETAKSTGKEHNEKEYVLTN